MNTIPFGHFSKFCAKGIEALEALYAAFDSLETEQTETIKKTRNGALSTTSINILAGRFLELCHHSDDKLEGNLGYNLWAAVVDHGYYMNRNKAVLYCHGARVDFQNFEVFFLRALKVISFVKPILNKQTGYIRKMCDSIDMDLCRFQKERTKFQKQNGIPSLHGFLLSRRKELKNKNNTN